MTDAVLRVAPASGTATRSAHRLATWAYAALALGLVLYVATIWIEVIIDTRKLAAPTSDLVAESHRHWRLRSTLLFLLWSVLGLITTPIALGWFAVIPAWIWYAYRVARGAIWFAQGRPIGAAYVRRARSALREVRQ